MSQFACVPLPAVCVLFCVVRVPFWPTHLEFASCPFLSSAFLCPPLCFSFVDCHFLLYFLVYIRLVIVSCFIWCSVPHVFPHLVYHSLFHSFYFVLVFVNSSLVCFPAPLWLSLLLPDRPSALFSSIFIWVNVFMGVCRMPDVVCRVHWNSSAQFRGIISGPAWLLHCMSINLPCLSAGTPLSSPASGRWTDPDYLFICGSNQRVRVQDDRAESNGR